MDYIIKDEMFVSVGAIKCLVCGDVVYSRANHDFHRCICGLVFVDGGNWEDDNSDAICGYHRIGGEQHKMERVNVILPGFTSLKEAKLALFNDWNKGEDHFGHIRITKCL